MSNRNDWAVTWLGQAPKTITLDVDEFGDLYGPIDNKFASHRRWSVDFNQVFAIGDAYYRFNVEVPATESQECYQDEYEGVLVEQVEVMTKVWREVA